MPSLSPLIPRYNESNNPHVVTPPLTNPSDVVVYESKEENNKITELTTENKKLKKENKKLTTEKKIKNDECRHLSVGAKRMNINNIINEVKFELLKYGAIYAKEYNSLVYEHSIRNYEGNVDSRKLFMDGFLKKYNDINKTFINNAKTVFNEMPEIILGGKKTMKKRIKNNKTRKGKQ